MSETAFTARAGLKLAGSLLLGSQLAYIAITQLHAGGPANDHHEIFEAYAHDGIWEGVHLGQFAAIAILLAGVLALARILGGEGGGARLFSRFAAAAAVAALALYAVLQAVDGVALKQVVEAWTTAPESERAARFAVAEAIRWLEWGMRGYFDIAFGLALLALGTAFALSRQFPAVLGGLVGLSGLAYWRRGGSPEPRVSRPPNR